MADSVWREFFDSYAPQYMNEAFTADSVREVEFLVEVLGLPAGRHDPRRGLRDRPARRRAGQARVSR